MKKFTAWLLCVCLLLALTGCGDKKKTDAPGKLKIVCSIFPQYDFTRRIAGEHAQVTQLLPPGMDSHEYEPSAKEILRLNDADLFIYTDDKLEGWVKNLKDGVKDVKLVRCADGIDLEALNEQWEQVENHEEAETHGGHDHEHGYDAHIWLDPTLAIVMCENIRDALIAEDPAHGEEYTASCALLTAELSALDADFTALFSDYDGAELFFGGKFAYSHFIRHYGLRYLSAYSGCSDEGEPGARIIVEMTEHMKKEGVKVIFTDEMSSGEVARAIADATGAQVLLFHSCHNLSAEEAGKTYLDLMRMNYDNVRRALEAQ